MLDLTARQKAALREGAAGATLVEMGHPDGTIRAWSGTGILQHGGHDWLGCGLVAGISGVESASDPEVSEVRFVMTGVPADVLNISSTSLKGYEARIYEAFLTPDGRVIDGLIDLDLVDLDWQEVEADEDGLYTITVIGQSGFWQLELASNAKWSPEEQKAIYPDDTGFDYQAQLIDLEVTWTRTADG